MAETKTFAGDKGMAMSREIVQLHIVSRGGERQRHQGAARIRVTMGRMVAATMISRILIYTK